MSVLYRIYRPKKFAEVRGQEHVIQTLQGALQTGRTVHAYLFSGPRGTGKTTIARLLAKTLNCDQYQKYIKEKKNSNIEPCNVCNSCLEINDNRSLDLIEIDAASNRGIDEIRALKDSARVAGFGQRKKIFIIDEVHMLTTAAANALLKTLEEPSAHIVFILATTEPHKILDTILSRVQRFDFKLIPLEYIVNKLKDISIQEKSRIDDSVFDMVARASGGSLRDAESILGALLAYGSNTVNTESAMQFLGILPTESYAKLLTLIYNGKTNELLAEFATIFKSGLNLESFINRFIEYMREQLIFSLNKNENPDILIRTIKAFVVAKQEMKSAPIQQLPIELAVIELTKTNGKSSAT